MKRDKAPQEHLSMAISSAMVRSVFDIDLINVINSLSAFARECIHEHGIIEHDAGDIPLDTMYEIEHFKNIIQYISDTSQIPESYSELRVRLAGTHIGNLLFPIGKISISDRLSRLHRSYLPYYAVLRHLLSDHADMNKDEIKINLDSRSGGTKIISKYTFDDLDDPELEDDLTIYVVTNESRTETAIGESLGELIRKV